MRNISCLFAGLLLAAMLTLTGCCECKHCTKAGCKSDCKPCRCDGVVEGLQMHGAEINELQQRVRILEAAAARPAGGVCVYTAIGVE